MDEDLKSKIAKYTFGAFGIGSIIGTYGIYMAYGPGGDGAIFGAVIGSIGAIIGGIAGFEFALKKSG